MSHAYQPVSFPPGELLSNRTRSNIGIEGYSTKRNLRRKDDVDGRREGVDYFMPSGVGDVDLAFDEARPGTEMRQAGTGNQFGSTGAKGLIHRSVRENGQEAILAGNAASGRLYRFIGSDDNDYWDPAFHDTDDYVIASVGRTSWAGHRLLITDTPSAFLGQNFWAEGMLMDSYSWDGTTITVNVTMQEGYRYVLEWLPATASEFDAIDDIWTEAAWYFKDVGDPTAALTAAYSFPAGESGATFRVREIQMTPSPWRNIFNPLYGYDSSDPWQAVNVNGYTVVNNGKGLPVVYRSEWGRAYPLWELRDQGIASVGGIASVAGMLVCYDIHEIPDSELEAWMATERPYDTYTGEVTRKRKSVLWSAIDNPFDMGMLYDVESRVRPGVLQLKLPTDSIKHGDKLTIYGGSSVGGNLEARVTSIIDSTTIQLDVDFVFTPGLTFQKTQTIGSTVGLADVTEDLGGILNIAPISNGAVIYMERGIVFSSYTGNPDDPFTFQNLLVPSDHSLRYPNSLVILDENTHVYAGVNRFYSFNYQSRRPRPITALEHCDRIVFDSLQVSTGKIHTNTGQPGARDDYYKLIGAHNVMTSEIWWSFPDLATGDDKILAYDYITNSVSTLDLDNITAMASVKDPVTGSDMFLMADATKVLNYGLSHSPRAEWDNGTEMYQRRTTGAVTGTIGSGDVGYVDYTSRLESGLGMFGDRLNPKDVRGVLIDTSSRTGSVNVTLTLKRSRYEAESPTTVGSATLNATAGPALFPVYARGHYFEHQIDVVGSAEWQIASLTYEVKRVGTRSNLRS